MAPSGDISKLTKKFIPYCEHGTFLLTIYTLICKNPLILKLRLFEWKGIHGK